MRPFHAHTRIIYAEVLRIFRPGAPENYKLGKSSTKFTVVVHFQDQELYSTQRTNIYSEHTSNGTQVEGNPVVPPPAFRAAHFSARE